MKIKDSIIILCLGILFSFSMFVFTANFNKSSKAAYVEENEYLLSISSLRNMEEISAICPEDDMSCVASNFGVTLNNYLYLDYNSFPVDYLGSFNELLLYFSGEGEWSTYLAVGIDEDYVNIIFSESPDESGALAAFIYDSLNRVMYQFDMSIEDFVPIVSDTDCFIPYNFLLGEEAKYVYFLNFFSNDRGFVDLGDHTFYIKKSVFVNNPILKGLITPFIDWFPLLGVGLVNCVGSIMFVNGSLSNLSILLISASSILFLLCVFKLCINFLVKGVFKDE